MINEFLYKSILPRLAETGLYEVLAGVAQPISRIDYDGDTEYQYTVPVSSSSNKETLENSDYEILVPDNSKASVAFFEARPLQIKEGSNSRQSVAETTIYFIAWYNLPRLAYCGVRCDGPFLPMGVMMRTKNALTGIFSASPFQGAQVETEVTRIQDSDVQTLISRYSFAADQRLFIAPYAACVYELKIKAQFLNACATAEGTCDCQIV